MTARTLYLSDELAAQVLRAAACAYPDECCGLIEGADAADGWRALAIHEARNIAEDKTRRFLIDPQAQFDLMRRLRDSEHRIIGCFHSHPDGRAEPSATDTAEAYETDFVYVIAAGGAELFTLKAYVFNEASGFSALTIAAPD